MERRLRIPFVVMERARVAAARMRGERGLGASRAIRACSSVG